MNQHELDTITEPSENVAATVSALIGEVIREAGASLSESARLKLWAVSDYHVPALQHERDELLENTARCTA